MDSIAKGLAEHVQSKHNFGSIGFPDTDNYISALRNGVYGKECKCGETQNCSSLMISYTAERLHELKTWLEYLQGWKDSQDISQRM